MTEKKVYFTTRDLLVMAILAALGGFTSTFINTIGDTFQAILGFPGATQWAAGFHILWLILSYGIIRKPGTGILTGILKGSIELISGNTHGVIILLVNIVAGLILDIILYFIQNKNSLWVNSLAAGLASASNVIVFQLFASLPIDTLAFGYLILLGSVAFISGVIFAAFLGQTLLIALRRAGVVKEPETERKPRRIYSFIFLGAILLAIGITIYLKTAFKGTPTISIKGSVSQEIDFPNSNISFDIVNQTIINKNIPTNYSGYYLLDIINSAGPSPDSRYILMKATDGYSFFLSIDELRSNPNILLVPNGRSPHSSYNIVGPQSTKAWIRNVSEIIVIARSPMMISGNLEEPFKFVPEDWENEMDSIYLQIGGKRQKAQGVPIDLVLEYLDLPEEKYVISFLSNDYSYEVKLSELPKDGSLRLFVIINDTDLTYALATMTGEVIIYPVNEIIIR